MAGPISTSSPTTAVADRNFLECDICYEPFDDPRRLPCMHVFCCQCLLDWSTSCSEFQKKTGLSCPVCKTVYPIPEGGVQAFPPHIHVTNMRDTLKAEEKTKSPSQYCEKHTGELKRNFCETCCIAVCPDCCTFDPDHKGHGFVRLKDIAKKDISSLEALFKESEETKQKFNAALQQTEQLQLNLERASKATKEAVDHAKYELIQRLEDLANALKKDIDNKMDERTREIDQVKKKLESGIHTITKTREQGTSAINSESEYEITSLYASLTVTLQDAITQKPAMANRMLSYMKFEPAKIEIKSLGRLSFDKQKIAKSKSLETRNETTRPSSPNLSATTPGKVQNSQERLEITSAPVPSDRAPTSSSTTKSRTRSLPIRLEMSRKQWKESEQIKISTEVGSQLGPQAIAIHPNGDIAVTSWKAPVTVYSGDGHVKHIMRGSPIDAYDIAISPRNEYVVTGKKGFHRYDSRGVLLDITLTFDVNNHPSDPRSVAVDSRGRIIVGLGFNKHKTVSVHQPDGSLVSKFESAESPRRLTCTPNDHLVISFYNDNTLRVMDQSGFTIARISQPPPAVNSWNPVSLCCSKRGEIFVGNWGQPKAVYRYVSSGGEYKYLDCITTMDDKPYGIALSANEGELFVVDIRNDLLKIFRNT